MFHNSMNKNVCNAPSRSLRGFVWCLQLIGKLIFFLECLHHMFCLLYFLICFAVCLSVFHAVHLEYLTRDHLLNRLASVLDLQAKQILELCLQTSSGIVIYISDSVCWQSFCIDVKNVFYVFYVFFIF